MCKIGNIFIRKMCKSVMDDEIQTFIQIENLQGEST